MPTLLHEGFTLSESSAISEYLDEAFETFDADIIEQCVLWYITYRLSYRDLVEMMAERGIKVAIRRSFDG